MEAEIPSELGTMDNWVVFSTQLFNEKGQVIRDKSGKPKKEPLPTCAGTRPSPTDREGWMDLGKAMDFVNLAPECRTPAFALHTSSELVFIDIDLPESGGFTPAQNTVIDALKDRTYGEKSTNGGYHFFLRGRLPSGTPNRVPHMEIYDQKRFAVITGDRLNDLPIRRDEQTLKKVCDILSELGGQKEATDGSSFLWQEVCLKHPDVPASMRDSSDVQVLNEMLRGDKSGKITALIGEGYRQCLDQHYEGDVSRGVFMVLESLLYRTKSPEQIWRVFQTLPICNEPKIGYSRHSKRYIEQQFKSLSRLGKWIVAHNKVCPPNAR